MSSKGLSTEYAEALYQVAVTRWVKNLSLAEERLRNVLPALDEPSRAAAEKEQLLAGALPGSELEQVRDFLLLLASKNHIHLLPEIVARFRRMTRLGAEAQMVHVTTAVPLTTDEETSLRAKLSARYGQGLDFSFALDPDILGGVIVRVGDTVIDGSIVGQLASLKADLSESL